MKAEKLAFHMGTRWRLEEVVHGAKTLQQPTLESFLYRGTAQWDVSCPRCPPDTLVPWCSMRCLKCLKLTSNDGIWRSIGSIGLCPKDFFSNTTLSWFKEVLQVNSYYKKNTKTRYLVIPVPRKLLRFRCWSEPFSLAASTRWPIKRRVRRELTLKMCFHRRLASWLCIKWFHHDPDDLMTWIGCFCNGLPLPGWFNWILQPGAHADSDLWRQWFWPVGHRSLLSKQI